MSAASELVEQDAVELYEEAPCGYLFTRMDGTIVRVNRTFERWTGLARGELVGRRRFQDLLPPGGRIFYETHLAPLLHMQGAVREIAVELVRADGSRLPALLNSTRRRGPGEDEDRVRITVFDATDRRRYETELLHAQRREQDIAQDLQRSLLAGELPRADGLELGVAYRPGVSGLEVGGDWYDAFPVREGEAVALVVGDVVGRGLGAAATMGQLRSAVRALASVGMSPGRLLASLDHYARIHRIGQATTLVYAELDLYDQSLCFACAGHPPPLLALAGREPELAWDGRGVPLDTHPARITFPEGRCELGRDATVVLYTDGLVERRGEVLDAGLDRLRVQVAAQRERSAVDLAQALAATLREPDNTDDVCLLVARLA